ncbi:MAG TPA: mannitol dehydrogenase family protein, partial [Paracoccaceae bacterium]
DGTEKLPQRIFAPALDALSANQNLRPFAFATASWMRHATRATTDCDAYDLRDPRADEIAARLTGTTIPAAIVAALSSLPGFMPEALRSNPLWTRAIGDILGIMLSQGMRAAIQQEAAA